MKPMPNNILESLKPYKGFFITVLILGFIYLVNSLWLEYNIVKINKLEKKLKDKQTKYSYISMELKKFTLQSEVEKKVKELNLNLIMPKEPPKIIIIKSED